MIDAATFLERARRRGLSWFTGVPCSHLGPLIDAIVRDAAPDYLAAANEGDAVAMAAGAFLGGRRGVVFMQNSGLGNAVNPITSLTWPFRIPVLLLVTLRGGPGEGDEPQHELMGAITRDLLGHMRVPFDDLPHDEADLDRVLDGADRHLRAESSPYALIVRKGTLASPPSRTAAASPPRLGRRDADAQRGYHAEGAHAPPTRADALREIVARTPVEETVVIAATGYTGRELFAIADRPNHFYMVGSMGCAASLGLGLSRARPDLRVVVVDGDGAALMRMGSFATVGAYAGPNLVHVVLDNGSHESTGGQATVAATTSFPGVAAACGYTVFGGCGLDALAHALASPRSTGPRFVHVPIRRGATGGLPRPALAPDAVRARLMRHIGSDGRAAA